MMLISTLLCSRKEENIRWTEKGVWYTKSNPITGNVSNSDSKRMIIFKMVLVNIPNNDKNSMTENTTDNKAVIIDDIFVCSRHNYKNRFLARNI